MQDANLLMNLITLWLNGEEHGPIEDVFEDLGIEKPTPVTCYWYAPSWIDQLNMPNMPTSKSIIKKRINKTEFSCMREATAFVKGLKSGQHDIPQGNYYHGHGSQ